MITYVVLYMHRSRASTQANGISELWYTIPYHLQPNNTWSICTTRGILRTPEREGERPRANKRKENKMKIKQKPAQTCAEGAVSRVLRGQSCCLLVRSVLRHVQLMDKHTETTQKNQTEDRRQGKKTAETRGLKIK